MDRQVDLGERKALYDTPGLLLRHTLTSRLNADELRAVIPKKQVRKKGSVDFIPSRVRSSTMDRHYCAFLNVRGIDPLYTEGVRPISNSVVVSGNLIGEVCGGRTHAR